LIHMHIMTMSSLMRTE